MKKIVNFLLQINKYTGSVIGQFGVWLIIIILLSKNNYLFNTWVLSGLIAYVYLWIKNYPKEGFSKIKQYYKEDGLLAFSRGLSYALILGPLSIILNILLEKTDS